MEQSCLFGPKFLEKFVGKNILYDVKVAIVELIANAWDAGAKEVRITWPTNHDDYHFQIEDDGQGMTKEEFSHRWRSFPYDRSTQQKNNITVDKKKRTVFGKNGVGRFSGFFFADSYFVKSYKNGYFFDYEVKAGQGISPLILIEKSSGEIKEERKRTGTIIYVNQKSSLKLNAEKIKSEIGIRFLTDPSFSCYVNGKKVQFSHIPSECITKQELVLPNGEKITITVIDAIESDKTTKQHGIAWHVNNRLVGEANWKDYGFDEIIDGRSGEAKRYTFIITADFLTNSVNKDWTGFIDTDLFIESRNLAFNFVRNHILGLTKNKREQTFNNVKEIYHEKLEKLTPLRIERWTDFVSKIQEDCTSLTDKDLIKLAGILVKMESSDSKFELINKLSEIDSRQIDSLNKILGDWTIDLAKEVLDELQIRLKLLDQIKEKVLDVSTREVQDLQPLFHQGLWIFGPEFETIEFTSNEGMTKVIQSLFKSPSIGTRNRPDFAILSDSTVGSYSYPTYDESGGEIGIDRLVIVELKKPGISISTDEKAQCWRYVKELINAGLINQSSKVTCFVLGSEIDPVEVNARKENDGRCIIQPLNYQTVVNRAKSRLLRLYDRVNHAPFFQNDKLTNITKNTQSKMDY